MLRDAQGALEDFKAAIKLSPYTAHVYFNRGNLYASMGHFDKAEADYSKGSIKYYYISYINYHKYINLIGQWVKIRTRDHRTKIIFREIKIIFHPLGSLARFPTRVIVL